MAYEQSGDMSDRNALVEKYMPLVKNAAERMLPLLPGTVQIDDLQSAGVLGLIDAIRNYQRERGVKFETFCLPRIRGAILDDLRLMDRFSRAFRVRVQKLERATGKLQQKLGREPTERELAEFVELSPKEVRRALHRKGISVYSLDALNVSSRTGEEVSAMDLVPDERGVDPVNVVQTRELAELAASLLSKVERQVIMLYYYDQLTMREIGELLNVSEGRVCQIRKRVIKRLRELLV